MWLLTQDEADTQIQDTEKVISIWDLGKKSRCIQVEPSAQHTEGCWPACLCLCLGERQVLFSLLIHFLSHSSCAIAIENCNRVWEALGFWVLPPDWTGECCCSGIMCEYHLLRGASVDSAGEAPSARTPGKGSTPAFPLSYPNFQLSLDFLCVSLWNFFCALPEGWVASPVGFGGVFPFFFSLRGISSGVQHVLQAGK